MARSAALNLILILLSGAAFAQGEEPVAEMDSWAGKASLGYLSTSGNTDTTSYSTKFEVGHTRNDWEHALHGASAGAEDGGDTTAENYQIGWRSAFLIGLLAGGALLNLSPAAVSQGAIAPPGLLVAAGLLVGFGARLANGCTSGHGVCGIARGSRRSITATGVFMAVGIATVTLLRHASGAGS